MYIYTFREGPCIILPRSINDKAKGTGGDSLYSVKMALQLLAHIFHRVAVDNEQRLHISCEQSAGCTYIDGRLLLVARKHPNFDLGSLEIRDCAGYIELQLILNGRGSHKIKVSLDLFCYKRRLHKEKNYI